jgi:hypothetical protein
MKDIIKRSVKVNANSLNIDDFKKNTKIINHQMMDKKYIFTLMILKKSITL